MFLHRGVCIHQKSQQGIQPFKLPLVGPVVFIDMNTTCIYLQKEAGVSKHIERKLCSCFGQLLLIY